MLTMAAPLAAGGHGAGQGGRVRALPPFELRWGPARGGVLGHDYCPARAARMLTPEEAHGRGYSGDKDDFWAECTWENYPSYGKV